VDNNRGIIFSFLTSSIRHRHTKKKETLNWNIRRILHREKERWERVLFDFNYYKCCSCDIIQYRRLFDRFGGTNVVGIKKRQTLSLFCLYSIECHTSWIEQFNRQAKEITQRAEKKRKILAMRWKHVFFGTRSRFSFLANGLKALSRWSKKNFSKRSFWSIYFKAQADCSVRLFIWVSVHAPWV
jgi:hypothetical protein